MKITSVSVEIGAKSLSLEVGRLAGQAGGAVVGRYGDTMVLATVVASTKDTALDYFPLSVEYIERLYAGGKIKGSRWVKREGRPSDEATLTARLVDRSIRPFFPEEYKKEVQVTITVLSVDAENDPDIPAICATSAALAISDIPWDGPVGGIRVGFVPKNGEGIFVANPSYQDLVFSELNMIVTGTEKAIVMLEGGAKEVSEEVLLKGMDFAQDSIGKIIKLIDELVTKVGKKKQSLEIAPLNAQLVNNVEKDAKKSVSELVESIAKKEGQSFQLEEIKTALAEKYPEEKKEVIGKIVEKLLKKLIRQGILKDGKRPDGRGPKDIRPIEMEVGVLPRTHGSAIFKRGDTQALTVTTLGSPSLEQLIESLEGEETKRYMHHYNMPPFSVGEVGRMGWPSRREVGHGALAERALDPVIPLEDKFPYAIRVVSEIMSSNGSSSMASVCGSSLSLMDAGVPIKSVVSGIAMGLIMEDEKSVILSDIIGLEDFNGDMDFKIAGTKKGITAMQMDVKTRKLGLKLLKEALVQAKEGRQFILEKMLKLMPESRKELSQFAPKVEIVKVPVEKIGEVIGPGGKIIRKIIAETGANVEVEDDGSVAISAISKDSVDKAVAWVKGLTREVKAGEIFEGEVKRIQPFGAFVEVLPGKDGLVHVSRMGQGFVGNPNDIVKIGQKVKVQVSEIDDMGRINLTMNIGEPGSKPAPLPPRGKFLPRRNNFPDRRSGRKN